MAKRVFLHVGTPKTGTTFLQRILWSNRSILREQQVLLPGSGIPDHFRACLDVREEPHLVREPNAVVGAWQRLVDEIGAWDGDAIVSHELFAPAQSGQTERAIAMLGDAEVHIVVTARDLVRQIPAEWQEHLKHRSTSTFSEFVRSVREDTERGPYSPNGYWFWHVQDLRGVLDRWGHPLPRHRVHVVTVPAASSDTVQLWERFAGLVGIQGGGIDLSKGRSNASLRAEQADLLRRLNSQLGERLPLPGPYPETVKSLLAHQLLAGRPGTRFGLLGEARNYAVQRSRTMVADLEDLHVDVVGDLEELLPAEKEDEGLSGDAVVEPEATLQEAVEALAAVLDRYAAERGRRQQLRRALDDTSARLAEVEAASQQGRWSHLRQWVSTVTRGRT